MRLFQLLIIYFFSLSLSSCAQDSTYVDAFKETKAYDLAVAVAKEDLNTIEKLVAHDSALMEFANPVNGSNVLELSIDIEKHRSFVRLLELGADVNYINPHTRYSVLINAIQPFGSQFEWRIDNRYVEGLLKYGADPNYSVDEDFITENGDRVVGKSPLIEASSLDLETVKMLVNGGADPNKKLADQSTGFSKAVRRGKVDIINYYIDSLAVDIHQPMRVVTRKPSNKDVTYYIQDYIVNKFTKAKLKGDVTEMERLKNQNAGIEEANEELWQLIQKLERMGVDFRGYDYK